MAAGGSTVIGGGPRTQRFLLLHTNILDGRVRGESRVLTVELEAPLELVDEAALAAFLKATRGMMVDVSLPSVTARDVAQAAADLKGPHV